MFRDSAITSFDASMPHLLDGRWMFQHDPLESFSTPLPSLTNGLDMFNGCKLNLPSVQTIARTIKDNSSMATPPTLTLGIAKGLQG